MYDKIIIGAGIYGLYAAAFCGKKGERVLVLEKEAESFKRATYVNQARVHLGYHYPRSLSTALSCVKYFDRFVKNHPDCIKNDFRQIYATGSRFSWTAGKEFEKFSAAAGIECRKIAVEEYFKDKMCDGAYLTGEATFDAVILRDQMLDEISSMPNVEVRYSSPVEGIKNTGDSYLIEANGKSFETAFVLNATYASVNGICQMAGFEPFEIKYELCEVILADAGEKLKDVGITVMDGPFFSIMPFGKTGLHSLTSVTFTPHRTSFDRLPDFECQKRSGGYCSGKDLGNCNECPVRPESAWQYMSHLAKKYLRDEYSFEYKSSLFSMKPILKVSDVDDSRPAYIKVHTENPTFVSVLSGKITTVYDLEEVL